MRAVLLALLVTACTPRITFGPQGYHMQCIDGRVDIEFPAGTHNPLRDEKGEVVPC